MFERFSPEAIKAIMLAQQTARSYDMAAVELDALLYGLLASGAFGIDVPLDGLVGILEKRRGRPKEIAPLIIEWSPDVREVFRMAPQEAKAEESLVVTPAHVLKAMWGVPLRELLLDAGIDRHSLDAVIGSGRVAADPIARRQVRVGAVPAKPPRTLREWFSDQAIGVVADAIGLARKKQSQTVEVEHLAVVVADAVPRVAPDVVAWLKAMGGAADQGAAVQRPYDDPEISEGLTEIFIEAKTQASNLASSYIEPFHFLLAIVRKEGPYDWVQNLINDYHAGSGAVEEQQKPLLDNDLQVRCTKRLAQTLQNAIALAGNRTVAVRDILIVLSEEARKSEANFIENREEALLEAERGLVESIAMSDADALRRIVTAAALHAQRLECARLDLNHLAIALLDEDDDAVGAVVAIFGEGNDAKGKRALKRRLENCVMHQAAQNLGYQREPGVLINLYDIAGSLRGMNSPL